jgi:signal transduction histidine kinase
VRSNITALRSMLIEIYPPDLAALGLGAALEELAASMSTPSLTVDVEIDELPEVGDEPSAVLFRTAREALRNVTSHAGASRATIRAGRTGGSVWLSVTDDGAGFDPAEVASAASTGHFGIRGLEGLAADVGGTFRVESAPEAGTMVVMELSVE